MSRLMVVLIAVLSTVLFTNPLQAQEERFIPQWWFGGAGGININYYGGSVQQLNTSITSPLSFTKGSGLGAFISPVLEYRPNPTWGGMLFFGFDGRSGSFNDVAAGNTTYSLSTSLNYLSIEPNIRLNPFSSGLYFFAGPSFGFNVAKSFTFKQTGAPDQTADLGDVRGTLVNAQVGAGYDIPLTNPKANSQVNLSPFLSINFGQGPSSSENWSLTSVRMGIALKFGSSGEANQKLANEIQFSVKAPKVIPNERKIEETFPLRNYVFFDEGSDSIPGRYISLSREQASNFKEAQFLQPDPRNLNGRSARQMTVYYNILNILGDRMRRIPDETITLVGCSSQGISNGESLANKVKNYLVTDFGIDGRRILTVGREQPEIPSYHSGDMRDVDLVKSEDRRVEINSRSLNILDPVQIISFQEEPLDNDVLFNVQTDGDILSSWSIELTDENGARKTYGPFTQDQERVSGKKILGDKLQGRYTVMMTGQTKSGQTVQKEDTFHLVRSDKSKAETGFRFSILFEFDQSKTVATYEHFLTNSVAPLISEGASVTIHGHTDIVGEDEHNLKLSRDRANQTQSVLEHALTQAGKHRVTFDTYGFGDDVRRAPFENRMPEERFYNRTVIIDIVPE